MRAVTVLSYGIVFYILLTVTDSSPAQCQKVVINAVGDIMLAGSGTPVYQRMGYQHAFANVFPELRAGDISVGNLEAPITWHGKEFTGKKFRFRTNPHAALALHKAAFSVLTLANNHMMDFGADGLKETLRNLDQANILYCGAGENLAAARKPALVTVGDKKIAFLAYSLTLPTEFYAGIGPGTAPGYYPYYKKDIAAAKSIADHVVVSFHWGAEKATRPKKYQIVAAHRAIDAGAEVVIGHHPHVLQGIEYYRNGVIFYSLGNFAFGSMSRNSGVSAIARVTLDNGVIAVELIPLNVLNSTNMFQPKILHGKRALAVIKKINTLSAPFATEIKVSGNGKRYVAQKKR